MLPPVHKECLRVSFQGRFEALFVLLRKEMPLVTVPEILRVNLSSVVLHLKAMGIEDVLAFDFMDAPQHSALVAAVEELVQLGALDAFESLTPLGRKVTADWSQQNANWYPV